MWKRYGVKVQVENRLMGGLPKNPDVIKDWLEARKPSDAAYRRLVAEGEAAGTPVPTLEALGEDIAQAVEPTEDKVWSGFKRDDTGLYIEPYQVKAHLKDAARVLMGFTSIKALRSKVAERVYPEPPRIYLARQDGVIAQEPDGYWEHPVHIMTAQGPRSALKRNDYLETPQFSYQLRVLEDKVIGQELLEQLLEYGGVHGIMAERGLGMGKYVATLEEVE